MANQDGMKIEDLESEKLDREISPVKYDILTYAARRAA
jgi:hypothetical protein